MATTSPPYPDVQLWYNGKPQSATSNKTWTNLDPSTAAPLATVHQASPSDIDAAVSSASAAFPSWSTTPPVARARILQNAVSILRARNDELATIETHDTGKPFSETSTVDVITGADVLEYYAGLIAGGGLNGETTQLRQDAWVYTKKEPLGVCAGIGAWNYPIQIALWKSAPCLAAGNCMVYKPSEVTPLHATRLAEIYAQAGLPPGVFNVVQGDGASVGQHLVSHPGIAKVSFTGQVSTGQKVAASAAAGMKYVTMELGGKSPLIILPDADTDNAVAVAMMANFFSTGQVCTNGTRVFVPRSAQRAFESKLLSKMPHIRPGPLSDPTTNFGPLVSAQHLDKVMRYNKLGMSPASGLRVLYSGAHQGWSWPSPSAPTPSRLAGSPLQHGYWAPPMVFTDCPDSSPLATDEIFGPTMCILPYDDSDPDYLPALLARANNTNTGLAAGVVTRDIDLAHRVIASLDAGITWINTWGESPAEMPVGGWKASGVGVENGRRGIEAWVRNKSTLVEMGGSVASVFEAVEGEADKEPRSKL